MVRRIAWNVSMLAAAALFAWALAPGEALAFQPQASKHLSSPQQTPPQTQVPAVRLPAVQAQPPSAGPIIRRTAPSPGQLPSPGQTKGFDVFTPSESGKMLPPGGAGEKGIIIVSGKPGEGGAEAIVDDNKPGQGGAVGIIDDNKPGQGGAGQH